MTVARARSTHAGVPPPAAAAPPGRRGLARPDPAPGALRPGRGHDHAAAPLPPPPAAGAGVTGLPSSRVVVDVVGAVRRPGLYRLAQGSRIADAVARAGGATAKADLAQVNLAAPLADGEQVVVPRRGAPGAAGGGLGSSGAAPLRPVQLSTATLEQLDSLPGVGPVTAQKILDYRAEARRVPARSTSSTPCPGSGRSGSISSTSWSCRERSGRSPHRVRGRALSSGSRVRTWSEGRRSSPSAAAAVLALRDRRGRRDAAARCSSRRWCCSAGGGAAPASTRSTAACCSRASDTAERSVLAVTGTDAALAASSCAFRPRSAASAGSASARPCCSSCRSAARRRRAP